MQPSYHRQAAAERPLPPSSIESLRNRLLLDTEGFLSDPWYAAWQSNPACTPPHVISRAQLESWRELFSDLKQLQGDQRFTFQLLLAQVGDRTAFDTLVHELRSAVIKVIKRVVRNHDDVEDLAQETFMRAWMKRAWFDPTKGSAKCWLFSIARHLAVDFLRRNGHRPLNLDVVKDWPGRGPAPSDRVEQKEMEERARRALEGIDPNALRAIQLRQEGLKYRQIAERLSVPIGTVASWVRRGIRQARKRLGSHNGTDRHPRCDPMRLGTRPGGDAVATSTRPRKFREKTSGARRKCRKRRAA